MFDALVCPPSLAVAGIVDCDQWATLSEKQTIASADDCIVIVMFL